MKDNKLFGKELEKRTHEFAVRIIRLSSKLPHTPEGSVVRNQITKSGTSIGANYREANRARSKADFRNKITICEGEASETQYWLEVIRDMRWISWEQLKPEYEECCELLAIFTSIGMKKRSNDSDQRTQ
ncbi:MAG TPA: four helix bundle protein [Desulfatiglandales bacterium]|nr:four helix bundle protein [Desulfatiglandales bacterium]